MANEDLQLINAIIGAIGDRMPTAKDRTQEEIQRDSIKMQMANLSLAGNAQTSLDEYRNLQLYGTDAPATGALTLPAQAEVRNKAEAQRRKDEFNIGAFGTKNPADDALTLVAKQFHEVTEEEAEKYESVGQFEVGMQIPQHVWIEIMAKEFSAIPLGIENSMYLYGNKLKSANKISMDSYANIEKIRLENTPINPDIFIGQIDEPIRRKIFFEPQTDEQRKKGEWTSKNLRPAETSALLTLVTQGNSVDKAMDLVLRKASLDAFNMPPMSIFVHDAYESSKGGFNESQSLDLIEGIDKANPFPLSIYKMEGALTSFKILYNAKDARGLAAVANLQGIGDALMKSQFYDGFSRAMGYSDERRALENLQQVQSNYFVITGEHFKPSPGIEIPGRVLIKYPEYGEAFKKEDYKDSAANTFNLRGTAVTEILDHKGEKVNPNDTSNIYLYQTPAEIKAFWDVLPETNTDSTQSKSYWTRGGATDEAGFRNYRAWYSNHFKNQVEMGHINPANFPKLKLAPPTIVPKPAAPGTAPVGLSTSAAAEIKTRRSWTIKNNLGRARRRSKRIGMSIKDILMIENGWSEEAAEHIIKTY